MKNMKKCLFSAVLGVLTVFLLFTSPHTVNAAKVNLLTNGTAESGLKGWKDPDKIWKSLYKYEKITPYAGSYFFAVPGFKGADGAQTTIYQDVSVKKYAGKKAVLSAYVRAWDTLNTDESQICLEFYDAGGKRLGKTSATSSKNPSWHKISVSKTIPENAVTARVSLCAVYHYGSEVDSYFDNVSLVVDNTSAKLSCLQIEMEKGSSIQLSGILADSSEASSVKWSSSKSSVASVNSAGKVRAKKKGKAMITCKAGGVSLKVQIKVK